MINVYWCNLKFVLLDIFFMWKIDDKNFSFLWKIIAFVVMQQAKIILTQEANYMFKI